MVPPVEEGITSPEFPGNTGPVAEGTSLEKTAAFSPNQANLEQLGDVGTHSVNGAKGI